MANDFKIGAGLALDGEAEFKKAVTGINKDLSVLGSEMKKVTAQFDGNATSMEALTAKQDVYNKRADEQRKKIEVMTAALDSAKKEFGENSDQVKNWQIKLNNAEADLAKTEKSLNDTTKQIDDFGKEAVSGGDAIEQAGKQAKGSGDNAQKGEGGWSKLGSGLAKIGKAAGQAVLALGTAALGTATAVGAMTVKAAYAADDINTLAKQTGLSTEEIQKFQYASKQIDVPMETLTGSMAKLTKNMESARLGSKNQAAAFSDLGISITDSEGKLRSNQDVFAEAIDALGKMENETQRDAYAMQLFGKSAQDLNPLILGGADALKQLGDEAEAAGLVLGQDSLDNLNLLSDAMDTFKATASGSGSLFGTAFAGPLAEGLNTLTGYMHELTTAFRDGGFDAFADKIGEVLAKLINKITDGLPKLVGLGMKMITKLIDGIIQNVPALVNGALAIVTQLASALLDMMPMLLGAGLQAVITLALGIADALPELIPSVIDAVLIIVETLIDNIDLLIDAAIAIIMALATGLIDSLPMLIEKIPELVRKLVDAVIENAPKLLMAAGALIEKLTEGLADGFVQIVGQIGDWINNNIINPIKKTISTFKSIGGDLIKGVWNGISDKAKWLWEKVSGFFTTLTDKIKNFFGIESPSRLFRDEIGAQLGAGLALGIQDSQPMVIDAAEKLSGALLNEEHRLLAELGNLKEQTAKTDEQLLEDSLNAQLDLVRDYKKQYDEAIAEVQKSQDNMAKKIAAFGDLFSRTQTDLGEVFKLANIQKQIDDINAYGNALSDLQARGVSDSLLAEIQDMSIEDATDYTNSLLAMTDEKYTQYMALWEEKQAAANAVAENFYKSEMDALKAGFVDKIPDQLSGIKDEMKGLGVLSGQGLAAGFASQEGLITKTFVGVLNSALQAARDAMQIQSPSRKWAEVGKYMAAGLGVGFEREMNSVSRRINNSIPDGSGARFGIAEGLVNGMAAVMGGGSGGAYNINVNIDGRTAASVMFDPLRNVAKQRGVALA